MTLVPHSKTWYDRLATLQDGYFYPWRSTLATGNGEEAYLALVERHLAADLDVLDVACGHGPVALDIAGRVRSVLGYDRIASWIERAQVEAARRGLSNARFVAHDSSLELNNGRAAIPAADASFDLLLCRRGPFHWLEDARRVARPGATLLMLVPNRTPPTPWSDWLPAPLGWNEPDEPLWAKAAANSRLGICGLAIESYWVLAVPETFATPEDLYAWRAWGYTREEVPAYAEVRPLLERIFAEFGGPEGLAVTHSRFLWKARVPNN
jgi:SAM-dependent methyltransferase